MENLKFSIPGFCRCTNIYHNYSQMVAISSGYYFFLLGFIFTFILGRKHYRFKCVVRLTGETVLSRVSEPELLSKSPWGRFGEEPLKFGED